MVNAARGDVASDVPLSTQAAAVAGLILSFATVHAAGAAPEAARAAGDALLQATEASFELLEPFCTTSGRGSPLRALQQGAGGPAAASVASSAAYQFGAERLSPFTPDRNGHGHAGELAAAEAFARQAQEAMLRCGLDEASTRERCGLRADLLHAALPLQTSARRRLRRRQHAAHARPNAPPVQAALQRVRIAVTVHVDINTFTYSQPTIFKADGEAGCGGRTDAHEAGEPCARLPPAPAARRPPAAAGRRPTAPCALRPAAHCCCCAPAPTPSAACPASPALPVPPIAEADEGGAWVVHVHAHPKSDYYAPGMESMLAPMSPCYFLKLRKAGLVALVSRGLGQPPRCGPRCFSAPPCRPAAHRCLLACLPARLPFCHMNRPPCSRRRPDHFPSQAMGLEGEPSEAVTSAAELNQRTLEAAVAAAPALFRDTYARRGKQLRFAPDK